MSSRRNKFVAIPLHSRNLPHRSYRQGQIQMGTIVFRDQPLIDDLIIKRNQYPDDFTDEDRAALLKLLRRKKASSSSGGADSAVSRSLPGEGISLSDDTRRTEKKEPDTVGSGPILYGDPQWTAVSEEEENSIMEELGMEVLLFPNKRTPSTKGLARRCPSGWEI
jgi:hypothetical protein